MLLPGLSARGLHAHKTIDQAVERKSGHGGTDETPAKGSSNETREDYHNAGLGVDRRVDDLLRCMTLAEKAGMFFQTMVVVGSGDLAEPSTVFGVESAEYMINNQRLTHFNVVRAADDARALAEWHSPGAASSD